MHHMNIELTRRCDQQCIYCFNDSGPKAQTTEMTVDQWITGIRHAAAKGLRSIHITGGEPFISPAAIPLLHEGQRLNLSTSILSNGLRIAHLSQSDPTLFRQLSVAQISLDAMDPAVHDQRRGKPGAWHQAIKAIDALKELEVPIEVSCTVDYGNFQEIDSIAAYTRKIGASMILRPVVALGRAGFPADQSVRGAVSSLEQKHSDVLVRDRFRYVPEEPNSDKDALEAGILTVLPHGQFRTHPVPKESTGQDSPIWSLLEVA